MKELKQEIEEYLTRDYCCEFKEECKDGIRIRCSEYEAKLYLILRFAEPREKQIEELEAQIEQMKCCANCRHSRTEYEHCRTDKHEKWEIKE